MAWIFLLKGTSFTVNVKDEKLKNDVLNEILDNDKEFEKLRKYANIKKLLLQSSYDEEDNFTVFCGFELYNERHIYAGQTITCGELNYDLEDFNILVSNLSNVLKNTFKDLKFKEKSGIILNQFD